MKKKTLVVLAAGMGSRFGGLKQAEKFGPNGEFIIDYSIFDAIRCGFDKVIFIIKEENYELFKETVGKRVEGHIKVEYAFQNFDNVDEKYNLPKDRVKPLGTAHAVLCAKDKIDSQFLVIGSDDFYGYEAFRDISKFMDENEDKVGVVGYKLINTLSDNGSVKRGVLFADKDNNFEKIVESVVEQKDGYIEAKPLDSDEIMKLDDNTLTSMIMASVPLDFINLLEKEFVKFLENTDLSKEEFYFPNVITTAKEDNVFDVKVVLTDAKHAGVTYKEDTQKVKDYIKELIDKGIYKNNLWE